VEPRKKKVKDPRPSHSKRGNAVHRGKVHLGDGGKKKRASPTVLKGAASHRGREGEGHPLLLEKKGPPPLKKGRAGSTGVKRKGRGEK